LYSLLYINIIVTNLALWVQETNKLNLLTYLLTYLYITYM